MQKTAYDWAISDLSFDVCTSDLHPIVDLQVRAIQYQSILGILNEFFKEIVGRTCVEQLGHVIPPASLALVSRRIVARTRARPGTPNSDRLGKTLEPAQDGPASRTL